MEVRKDKGERGTDLSRRQGEVRAKEGDESQEARGGWKRGGRKVDASTWRELKQPAVVE